MEDGSTFEGRGFGFCGVKCAEIVFNTSMAGYQEILTDPSYAGQTVVFTFPHIGNYGVNPEDVESKRVHLCGIIVKSLSPVHSNWRASGTLEDFLRKHGVIAIEGIDTREITRRIRTRGVMNGILSTSNSNENELKDILNKFNGLDSLDLASMVTRRKTEVIHPEGYDAKEAKFHVVAVDFGIKMNIARNLLLRGCKLTIMPAWAKPDEILSAMPDGIFLSNGPGNPEMVHGGVDLVKSLINNKNDIPIFGICLGHQILALALGAKTYKLTFGHRGANHPVYNNLSGRVEITAQNHGFAVMKDGLPSSIEITHTSLNDGTVEGLRHNKLPIFSVQYHPESSPGPHDSLYLFDEFINMLKKRKKNG